MFGAVGPPHARAHLGCAATPSREKGCGSCAPPRFAPRPWRRPWRASCVVCPRRSSGLHNKMPSNVVGWGAPAPTAAKHVLSASNVPSTTSAAKAGRRALGRGTHAPPRERAPPARPPTRSRRTSPHRPACDMTMRLCILDRLSLASARAGASARPPRRF